MQSADERNIWLRTMLKISDPVLVNLANDTLTKEMPYLKELDVNQKRKKFANLEAFGRVFNGIAPWLQLTIEKSDKEYELQEQYKQLASTALTNLVDPKAEDYVDFGCGPQCLVDAAYLCQGILRYPSFEKSLAEETKLNLVLELKKTRKYPVAENNWLLFASTLEATLLSLTNQCDLKRLNIGVKKFIKNYYVGDGMYGDGQEFFLNYYNSYVIHPMLTDVLKVAVANNLSIKKYYSVQIVRQQRYLELLERLVSPQGTYPVLGRTITCRLGAFHSMAQSVLQKNISENLSYGQLRCAMTALLKKQFDDSNFNFTENGWLKVGFTGEQFSLAEEYINIGSSYHTCTFFLPLGLPHSDSFWTSEPQEWTNLKIWQGEDSSKDKALIENNTGKFKKLKAKVKYKFKKILR